MKKQFKTIAISLFAGLVSLQSCIKDPQPDQPPVNENELITTLILQTTDSSNGLKQNFIFRDPDGEGGNSPVQFDSILLKNGHTYYTEILLLDESKSAIDTVSQVVLSEGAAHLFVFTNTGIEISVKATDQDKNGLPIGLSSTWRALGVGNGKTKITLKHQPGLKNGDPLIGETDLEVEFESRIQ